MSLRDAACIPLARLAKSAAHPTRWVSRSGDPFGRAFPAHRLATLESRFDEAPVTAAIIGLGRSPGLTVIAEGVEEEHQVERLRRPGCHVAQGFYFARPQPGDDITELLEANITTSASAPLPPVNPVGVGSP
jgi:EAL domain